MNEIIEFDVVEEYNIFKVGIPIDTNLKLGDRKLDVIARIDTGSTFSVFNRYFGEQLGVESETGLDIKIGTATGSFGAFGHELTLTVLGLEFISTVYFAESANFDRNVLGRTGFLDRVKFGLIEPEGKVFLSRYTD